MNEEAYKRYLADIEAILVKAQHPPVLSRRDCFAMAAMQGLLACEGPEHGFGDIYALDLDAEGNVQYDDDGEIKRILRETAEQSRAARAVEQADALIAALNEPQPTVMDATVKTRRTR